MPHIIVEYSKSMETYVDVDGVLLSLHDTLAAQGVDKARIKTRGIPLTHAVVGEKETAGVMAHATLLLLEGRDVPMRHAYGAALHDVMKKAILAQFPQAAITLEVREMVKDTYFL